MASFVSKRVSTNSQPERFSIYLVLDGNQIQLVKIPNDVRKRVVFRNEGNQILQALALPGVSVGNQPISFSYETNGDSVYLYNCLLINNLQQQQHQTPINSFVTQKPHEYSSQSVNIARTSSSCNTQQNNSTNIRTRQSTHKIQLPSPVIPTSIDHGYPSQIHDCGISPIYQNNDSSSSDDTFNDSTTEEEVDHLSVSQRTNHHPRFDSLSNKKRQRSYEHDVFMNKRIKSDSSIEDAELTITSFNDLHSHKHNYYSSICPVQQNPSRTSEGFHRHVFSTSSRTTSTPRPSFITLPTTATNVVENDDLPMDPNEWTVFQVQKWIGHVTDHTIGQAFRRHEIDGKALLLLSKEDLRDDMKIVVGPLVIIIHKIKELRERVATS